MLAPLLEALRPQNEELADQLQRQVEKQTRKAQELREQLQKQVEKQEGTPKERAWDKKKKKKWQQQQLKNASQSYETSWN